MRTVFRAALLLCLLALVGCEKDRPGPEMLDEAFPEFERDIHLQDFEDTPGPPERIARRRAFQPRRPPAPAAVPHPAAPPVEPSGPAVPAEQPAEPPGRAPAESPGPDDARLTREVATGARIYENRFFSLEIKVPRGWHVLASRDLESMLRSRGSPCPAGGVCLLSASRYPPGKPGPKGEFNAHFLLAAMDIRGYSGIRSGKDFAELQRAAMKAFVPEGPSEPVAVNLGGCEFWRIDAGVPDGYLTWLGTVRKGHGLSFQLMAGLQGEIDRLVDILGSVRCE